MSKRRKFYIFHNTQFGNSWIVENTINLENNKLFHFKAAVRTRKLARELVKILKKKYV